MHISRESLIDEYNVANGNLHAKAPSTAALHWQRFQDMVSHWRKGDQSQLSQGLRLQGGDLSPTDTERLVHMFREQFPLPESETAFVKQIAPNLKSARVQSEVKGYRLAVQVALDCLNDKRGPLALSDFPEKVGYFSWKKLLEDRPEHEQSLIFSGTGKASMLQNMRNHWWHFRKVRTRVSKQIMEDRWSGEDDYLDPLHDVFPQDVERYLKAFPDFFHQGFDFDFMDKEAPQRSSMIQPILKANR